MPGEIKLAVALWHVGQGASTEGKVWALTAKRTHGGAAKQAAVIRGLCYDVT